MTTQAQQPYATASLYCGDLDKEVNEAQLYEIFNTVGSVASVRVCRDAMTRRSLGYAYINFQRVEDAERALETLNFSSIKNRPCRLMWSNRNPAQRRSGTNNIFVKNLHPSIDTKTLFDTFSTFGNIRSCKVAMSPDGASLGYGFVDFESEESAKTAIERVNGKLIHEQIVTVSKFIPREERNAAADKKAFQNVYINNLPETYTEEQLQALFAQYGKIAEAKGKLAVFLSPVQAHTKSCFGFVHMQEAEAAAAAVAGLNGTQIDGKQVLACRAQMKSERQRNLRNQFESTRRYNGVNLYVKNLAENIDDARLATEFQRLGNILSHKVMIDPATQKSKGFGFVSFASADDATKAVTELNGFVLEGKPLYVALAQPKEVRRQEMIARYAQRYPMINPVMGVNPMMGGPMYGYYPPQAAGYPRRFPMPPRGVFMAGRPPMGPGQQQRVPGMRPPMNNGRPPQHMAQGKPLQNNMRGQQQRPPNPAYKIGPGVRNTMSPQINAQPQLTIEALAQAPEEAQKQMIGERLFPLIAQQEAALAGKITGMLLEMDNSELLHLIESPEARLEKIREAMLVLQTHAPEETA